MQVGVGLDHAHGLTKVGCIQHCRTVRQLLENAAQSFANEDMVVDQKNFHPQRPRVSMMRILQACSEEHRLDSTQSLRIRGKTKKMLDRRAGFA
jgi:hypothetical protein